jgi:hypothetical protein
MIGNTVATAEQVQELLDYFKLFHIGHIETSVRYPSGSPGRSEALLGEVQTAK